MTIANERSKQKEKEIRLVEGTKKNCEWEKSSEDVGGGQRG